MLRPSGLSQPKVSVSLLIIIILLLYKYVCYIRNYKQFFNFTSKVGKTPKGKSGSSISSSTGSSPSPFGQASKPMGSKPSAKDKEKKTFSAGYRFVHIT